MTPKIRMEPKKIKQSKREFLADQAEAFIAENGLAKVYGGQGLSKDNKFRYILFNTPRTLDGEIRIYNARFVAVKFQTAYRDLPKNGWYVFKSLDDAQKFIEVAFVRHEFEEALSFVEAAGRK